MITEIFKDFYPTTKLTYHFDEYKIVKNPNQVWLTIRKMSLCVRLKLAKS